MAIRGTGRFGYRAALGRLEALLGEADVPTAEEIAHAMERIGDPAAESGLLRLLRRDSLRVKTAAAQALGAVGTVAAVEPLLESAKGPRAAGGFKNTARQAIARIQSRLGDAEAGRLSLITPAEAEGALSIAHEQEKRGGLSVETEGGAEL